MTEKNILLIVLSIFLLYAAWRGFGGRYKGYRRIAASIATLPFIAAIVVIHLFLTKDQIALAHEYLFYVIGGVGLVYVLADLVQRAYFTDPQSKAGAIGDWLLASAIGGFSVLLSIWVQQGRI